MIVLCSGMVPSSFVVPNSKVSGFGDLEPFAAMSVSLPATLAVFAGAAPSLAPSSWLSVSFVHKGGRVASLLVALCGLVDPGAQAAAAATLVVFSVDALKGALIMLLEDCVSGAVAGSAQFLSSWSVVETYDERPLLGCWKWRVCGYHGLVGMLLLCSHEQPWGSCIEEFRSSGALHVGSSACVRLLQDRLL